MKNDSHSSAYKLCISGTSLKQRGDYEAALQAYNQALKEEPMCATAYYERADIPGLEVSEEELERMQQIVNT